MSQWVMDWSKAPNRLLQKESLFARQPSCYSYPRAKRRCLSSSVTALSPRPNELKKDGDSLNGSEFHGQLGHRAREKLADKEFFFSLLNSASTKREVKSYLSRFRYSKPESTKNSPPKAEERPTDENVSLKSARSGVNLGGFFGGVRAVEQSPVFRQEHRQTDSRAEEVSETLHVALIKLRSPQLLDDQSLRGIGRTLSQLTRLDMRCCVVIDPGRAQNGIDWRQSMTEQADRLCAAIDASSSFGPRRLDTILSLPNTTSTTPTVLSRKVLISPLRKGHITVIIPMGYTQDSGQAVPLQADDVVLSLTKEFAGLWVKPELDEDPAHIARRIRELQKQISLDRMIILDPLGGIPASNASQKSHVFINMEQEYDDIEHELLGALNNNLENDLDKGSESKLPGAVSNPFSKFVETDVTPLATAPKKSAESQYRNEQALPEEEHLANLRLMQRSLAFLSPSSSGIITTPQDAANSSRPAEDEAQFSAVGTRRKRNPLLHNLLTDKPVHSASLPLGRLEGKGDSDTSDPSNPLVHSTFVKKGMPLTVIPHPRVKEWTAGNGGEPRLTLDDPRIDLPRLVHLIEDSFNRKLDLKHYLDRVNDRIAGLIIAGEYEGGAILTWETPPGVVDDGSEESLSRMVPYLDKFAVLKRSQGAGGVADIVFNAMVRGCFPRGVCWRSRQDNPVNKWYFERARGTWKIPDSNWTMFWTTPGVPEDGQRFLDYEGVCRDVVPSWADNHHVVD
ncbi:Amino-acid acetyltransferase, mitochondrial [Arachnomyces sp. PD_36]|nr:Amino-acid acetyltransferase, mitochondrial [Arachnomyces sp. PD_36]